MQKLYYWSLFSLQGVKSAALMNMIPFYSFVQRNRLIIKMFKTLKNVFHVHKFCLNPRQKPRKSLAEFSKKRLKL